MTMNGVRTIKVTEEDDGQRLDRWLKKRVPEIPYGLMQKFIRKGAIRVDGKRGKTDTRLAAGQEIRIPPVEDKPQTESGYRPGKGDEAFVKSITIYDDGDIMAINKPWGLASQGGGGVERHVDGMMESVLNKKGLRPRLIHRLDRDTSGILLLARSAEAVRRLGKIFMGRRVRKIYWAITAPAPSQDDGVIEASLVKGMKGAEKDRMIIDDGEDSKHAITDFSVLERAGKQAAFVAFWPRTGRTHQIRVHAADALKCPIVGDPKYGGAEMSSAGLAPRLHLHARRLVLEHPMTGKELEIIAPLPDELKQSWKALGFDPNTRGDPFRE
jgi:23S rRNA pseudouridine955/2504/2580 synthase